MKYKWYNLIFPKQPTATWSFMVIKMTLLIIFFATFIFETGWNVYCMKIYRDKVIDVKASTLFASRSEIQVLTTHSHFFLFTGMMSAGAVLVGVWGILMEYMVIIVGYCYIHTVATLFETIGAYFSGDDQVAVYKVYGIFPEPFLIMFGLIFAHMVRVGERELASSPLYKQKMAARAGKGETMAYTGNDGIEATKLPAKDNNNSLMAASVRTSASAGFVNQGLELNEGEDERQPSPTSSGISSTSASRSTPDEVTVSVDGASEGNKTRLEVHDQSHKDNTVTVAIEQ